MSTPASPSNKIELFSQAMQDAWGYGVPRYEAVPAVHPLNLISPSSSKRTNATFGGHAASSGPERLEMHPRDAQARGLGDGTRVRAWNDLGEVRADAQGHRRGAHRRGLHAQGHLAGHQRHRSGEQRVDQPRSAPTSPTAPVTTIPL
ncbi:MAG: molybdopterin dinucleotide binding domain-containing protein [Burkholderiaceae bacterium]